MKKAISIILLSSIITATVVSTPMSLFAASNDGSSPNTPPVTVTLRDTGSKFAEPLGENKGKFKGKKDALDKKIFNWESAYSELDLNAIFNIGRGGEYLEGFIEGYKKGFEKGYGEGYMEVLVEKREINIDYGTQMGEKDAISDYYQKLPIDHERNMLADEDIIKKFDIIYEDEAYKEAFVVFYKVEYKKAYLEKYRELRKDNFDIDTKGYNAGKEIGTKMGEAIGKIDFVTPNAKNDWEKAFKKFEKQKSLVGRYFLDREPEIYKDSFISGFREAFRIAYNEAYQKSNVDISINNINFAKVAMLPAELKFNPSDGVGNAGGTLKIPGATFYEETHIGVSMERDSFNYKNEKYTPTNHLYNIAVASDNERIKLNKALSLDLEYLGVERAGIYQLVGDEWRYMYTVVTEGNLHTEIPEGMYRGGTYAIFIDEDYVPITDIRNHWANKELYTFLRRDYIKGDEKAKYSPNDKMSRGEFLSLLGKTFNWNYEHSVDNTSKFSDGDNFNEYKEAVNYAANMGYVGGHEDGTFRPYDKITYNQIEWILRKVLFEEEFKWDLYEDKMGREKFTKSDSVNGKNRPVSKGEVVYMLYELQKKLI